MKQETKDRIVNIFFKAAMITPPWNILCWTIGAGIYYLGGVRKQDASGDAFLGLVLGAPVTLPMILFERMREKREMKKFNEGTRVLEEAAKWIAEELKKSGISVSQAGRGFLTCRVHAEVGPDQIEKYRDVYRRALEQFPDLTPRSICLDARPLEPLNKEWAQSCGLSEYAMLLTSEPCVKCGKQDVVGSWLWRPEGYLYSPGETWIGDERITGYICDECKKKIELIELFIP